MRGVFGCRDVDEVRVNQVYYSGREAGQRWSGLWLARAPHSHDVLQAGAPPGDEQPYTVIAAGDPGRGLFLLPMAGVQEHSQEVFQRVPCLEKDGVGGHLSPGSPQLQAPFLDRFTIEVLVDVLERPRHGDPCRVPPEKRKSP